VLPHGFAGKFKSQKVDAARRVPLSAKTIKLAKALFVLRLIICHRINSFSKHFRLHTTATSLGLPELRFCKSFASLEVLFHRFAKALFHFRDTKSS